jgi:chromosome segregation ATPase
VWDYRLADNKSELSDTMMEIASLAQEKEEVQERLDRERLLTKELRDQLWREQNLRAAVDAANKDLKTRLLEVRGVIEANLESLLIFPEVLSLLKSKVVGVDSSGPASQRNDDDVDVLALASMQMGSDD